MFSISLPPPRCSPHYAVAERDPDVVASGYAEGEALCGVSGGGHEEVDAQDDQEDQDGADDEGSATSATWRITGWSRLGTRACTSSRQASTSSTVAELRGQLQLPPWGSRRRAGAPRPARPHGSASTSNAPRATGSGPPDSSPPGATWPSGAPRRGPRGLELARRAAQRRHRSDVCGTT